MPRRGEYSPPGPELLGVITSRGPSRECYRSGRKSRGGPAEAIAWPAANTLVSTERLREALSSPAGAPTILQQRVPGGGAAMVTVESPGYRATTAGKEKRNGQSRRYRERIKIRKPAEPEAVNDPARVITTEHFFRSLLRPARMLRAIRSPAAKSLATLLLAGLPARSGARPRPGAALETGARFSPEILIWQRCSPYIQPV